MNENIVLFIVLTNLNFILRVKVDSKLTLRFNRNIGQDKLIYCKMNN